MAKTAIISPARNESIAGWLTVDHLSMKDLRRIFSKVEVNEETGCWEWTAYLNDGYGRIRLHGRMEVAHRVLYAWACGPIPRGLRRDIPQLDHVVCDNTKCCNPSHLRLVLAQENILRGNGATAKNARRRICKRGHLMPDKPNVRIGERWVRCCLPCRIQDRKEYHQAKMNGPDVETYRARRTAQSRKDNAKPERKEYVRLYSRRRRNGPDRERILEKDRLSQQERRDRLREAI